MLYLSSSLIIYASPFLLGTYSLDLYVARGTEVTFTLGGCGDLNILFLFLGKF